LVVRNDLARLLQVEVSDQPGDARLLVVVAAVLLVGGGMNCLAALTLGGALLRREDQIVVLQEALHSTIAIGNESRWCCDRKVRRDPLEVLAHRGQRPWRRG